MNTHKMSDEENKNDHWYLAVINWGKCLTRAHFVQHASNNFRGHWRGGARILFPPPNIWDWFCKVVPKSVIVKYAGHVRQTSADVRQRAQTLPDILSSRAQYT